MKSPISSIVSDDKSEKLLLSIQNYVLTLPKWQTTPFTAKIVQQLSQEPEVVIERNSCFSIAHQSENNCHNVPDLSNVVNEVEVTSNEELYSDYTPHEIKDLFDNARNIEGELAKMFGNVDESKHKKRIKPTISNKTNTPKRIKHQKPKKDILLRLFGSPLDDLEEPRIHKPANVKMVDRRHSLPVSINIGSECLKPLKVNHKRKSEADATIACKVRKTQRITAVASPQVLYIEHRTASELVVPPVYTATARKIETELKKATTLKRPVTNRAETVEAKKSTFAFIDLTKDDSGFSVITYDGIEIEIIENFKQEEVKQELVEASQHSETAQVPVSSSGLSMPLLSPVSATVPAHVEAILPHDTVQTDTSRPKSVDTSRSLQPPPPDQHQSTVSEVTIQILPTDKPETNPNQNKSEQPKKKGFIEERPHTLAYHNPMPHIAYAVPRQPINVTVQQQTQTTQPQFQQSVHKDIRKVNHSVLENMVRLENQNMSSAIPNQTNAAINFQASGLQPQQASNGSLRNQRPRQPTTSVPQSVQQQQYTTTVRNVLQSQQQSTGTAFTNQWLRAQQQNQAVTQPQTYQQQGLPRPPPPSYTQQQALSNVTQQVNSQKGGLCNGTQQHSQQHGLVNTAQQQQRLGNSTQLMNQVNSQQRGFVNIAPQLNYRLGNPTQILNLPQNTTQQLNSQNLSNVTQQLHSQQHGITQPLNFQHQRLGNTSQFMNLPQLVQLTQSAQAPIKLVSNVICAEKILPHLLKLMSWKKSVCNFYDQKKVFFTNAELKEDSLKFSVYCDETLKILGRKLLKDLSVIDVTYFSVAHILHMLSTKLTETDGTYNVYRVWGLVNLLMTACEAECNTPFLKKFCSSLKVATDKVEQRRMQKKEAPKFTLAQLQLLEKQIKQCRLIQNWLDVQNQNQRQTTNVPVASPRSQQSVVESREKIQKKNEACTQARTTQPNTVNTLQRNNDRTILPVTPAATTPQRVASNQTSFGNTSVIQNSTRSQENTSRNNASPNTSARTIPLDQLGPVLKPTSKPQDCSTVTASTWQVPSGLRRQDNFDTVMTPVMPTTQTCSDQNIDAICEKNVPERSKEVTESVVPASETAQTLQNRCNNSEDLFISETNVYCDIDQMKQEFKAKDEIDDIIDLTWIDDANDEDIEEFIEFKTFPFKSEDCVENEETTAREVLSPADSGLGSPVIENDGFKCLCLCGNKAIYVCACKSSMYCSSDCQERDWVYHQKLCHKMKS